MHKCELPSDSSTRDADEDLTRGGHMDAASRADKYRDPLRLSQWLLTECLKRGVHLHQPAKVVSIVQDKDGTLSGVRVQKSGAAEVEGRPIFFLRPRMPRLAIAFADYPSSMQSSASRRGCLDSPSLPDLVHLSCTKHSHYPICGPQSRPALTALDRCT